MSTWRRGPSNARRNVDHGHGEGSSDLTSVVQTRNTGRGMGDLQLGLRAAVVGELTAGLTVKLPTGATNRVTAEGIVDPMLQPGSGSIDVAGSVLYLHRLGGTTLTVSASAQKTTRGTAGYRHGDELVLAAGAQRRLAPRVAASDARQAPAGRHELGGLGVPSTGATLVLATPGVRVRLGPAWTAYGSLQLPLYLRVNESQLGPRAILTTGVVKTF